MDPEEEEEEEEHRRRVRSNSGSGSSFINKKRGNDIFTEYEQLFIIGIISFTKQQ